ncbi:hypothetical protein EET67_10925 [Pseudaminobacter arsenicus]|uniref:Uncharacterized protein n=1 Tax=Borborobacter arsenicus TaxID=1851146 RepID=A0A432V6M0_9HYPH|nr:hypothetical protein [Pseudaminobacter arsenicus]RUM97822.1 hypothetical protein EET67_10925 [Pseudaminobacter arsenicus]
MPENWSFQDLIAAGWSEADLEWERLTVQALSDLATGRAGDAFDGFGRALRLARTDLAKDDPRLATSLSNHAAAMAAAGEGAMTGQIRASAAQAWASCQGWVVRMTAPRTARSSMFHLRMERLHRPAYEERWREKGRELLVEVQGRIGGCEALVLIDPEEAHRRVERWQRERPVTLSDPRKLLGAVILLAAKAEDPDQRDGNGELVAATN